jgi:hypothetical protein
MNNLDVRTVGEERSASAAAAPGGPAERHQQTQTFFSLWGQAPKPPASLRSNEDLDIKFIQDRNGVVERSSAIGPAIVENDSHLKRSGQT